MTGPLWLLLWFQLKGWARTLFRSMRTVRGVLLALVGLAVVVMWIGSMALSMSFRKGGGISPDQISLYGPAALLAYCLLNVAMASSERSLYFTPAEVQFLFPGPFTRRQILAYKVVQSLLLAVPTAFFLTAAVRIDGGRLDASILGLLLVTVFMQLFGMIVGLIGATVEQRLLNRSRRALFVVAAVVVGLAYLQYRSLPAAGSALEAGNALLESRAWKVATWPLASFFDTMKATSAAEIALPFAIGALTNVVLVAAIMLLDAQYLESADASSARLYAKIQRMRGRNAEVETRDAPKGLGWGLPMLPYLGGVGPLLWRQLISASRTAGKVFLIVGLAMSGILGAVWFSSGGRENVIGPVVGVGVWLSIFLPSMLPFDFRGDIDRMAVLKTLPVSAWKLVVGQLVTPTLFMTAIQFLFLAFIGGLSLDKLPYLAVVAVYALPLSFLLIALENLFFLLYPVRLMGGNPGDFQAMGRNVLLALAKMVTLGVVAAGVVLPALLAYYFTRVWWVSSLAGLPVVLLASAGMIPLCAKAFEWFDAGRETTS